MRPWVRRVLALPWAKREVLVISPPRALPAEDAWRTVEALADPDCTDLNAPTRLVERMGEWAGLYLTPEGRRRLSGVVRQRRHRRRAGAVTITLPADLHHRLVRLAAARGLSVQGALNALMEKGQPSSA